MIPNEVYPYDCHILITREHAVITRIRPMPQIRMLRFDDLWPLTAQPTIHSSYSTIKMANWRSFHVLVDRIRMFGDMRTVLIEWASLIDKLPWCVVGIHRHTRIIGTQMLQEVLRKKSQKVLKMFFFKHYFTRKHLINFTISMT